MLNILQIFGGNTRGAEQVKTPFMIIVTIVVVLFIALPIMIGIAGSDEWQFGIELANPRFNSFEIGITNRNYEWDNGDQEQELRIGFLILTISASFFRNSA